MASKPFDVLLYLAGNSGRVVEKNAILQTIWKGVSVTEANLTQTIYMLRNTLKHHDAHPYIVSAPGRGYQLAAEVRMYHQGNDGASSKTDAHLFRHRRATRTGFLVPNGLRSYTSRSLRMAIRHLGDTIQQKPGSAAAYVDFANAHCLLINAGDTASQQAFPAIQDAVLRALEIDLQNVSAYAPLGFLRCHLDRDWAQAEKDFQRCMDGGPNDLLAYHWYAELLTSLRRFDHSLQLLRRAERLWPHSGLIQTDIAQVLFYAREYRDCEPQLLKAVRLRTSLPFANVLLGCTYRLKNRPREAIRLLEQVVLQKNSATALAALAGTYAAVGDQRRASRILHSLQAFESSRYISPYTIAFAAVGMGKSDLALHFLEQAEREKDYWMLWLRLAAFDPLRREPRFRRLLQNARLS
ncbi:MAG TPA: winged helix-turn-helix domain-containing protein [Candidatus Angelobacter sp.]